MTKREKKIKKLVVRIQDACDGGGDRNVLDALMIAYALHARGTGLSPCEAHRAMEDFIHRLVTIDPDNWVPPVVDNRDFGN